MENETFQKIKQKIIKARILVNESEKDTLFDLTTQYDVKVEVGYVYKETKQIHYFLTGYEESLMDVAYELGARSK